MNIAKTSDNSQMINNLIESGRPVSFKQGDRLSRAGEFPGKIYYIREGTVRLLTMSLKVKAQ